jgi:hypothetical protein
MELCVVLRSRRDCENKSVITKVISLPRMREIGSHTTVHLNSIFRCLFWPNEKLPFHRFSLDLAMIVILLCISIDTLNNLMPKKYSFLSYQLSLDHTLDLKSIM